VPTYRNVSQTASFATLGEANENRSSQRLIIQSQNRMHVVELGHGDSSAALSRLQVRDPVENRKSLSQYCDAAAFTNPS
jgi:hypothetical protein